MVCFSYCSSKTGLGPRGSGLGEEKEMSDNIKNFRDLKIWQQSMDMVVEIYSFSGAFPKNEFFGLVSQIRRAAVSIPANIAEGFNRFHRKDYARFLYIAMGSCAELETHIEISSRLDFISSQIKTDLLEKLNHISRMTRKLIKNISSSKDEPRVPNPESRVPRTESRALRRT